MHLLICTFWYKYVYFDTYMYINDWPALTVFSSVVAGESDDQLPEASQGLNTPWAHFFRTGFSLFGLFKIFWIFFTYFRITAMTMEWNTLVPAMEWATLKWRPFIKFLEKASTFWESCWLCPLGRWILSRSIGKEYPKKGITNLNVRHNDF